MREITALESPGALKLRSCMRMSPLPVGKYLCSMLGVVPPVVTALSVPRLVETLGGPYRPCMLRCGPLRAT